MVFSSLVFLYLFLPAVLLTYFVCPKRHRMLVLLVMSLLFYGYGEPRYLVVMFASIALNFLFGAAVGRCRDTDRARARRLVAFCVACNLLLLCFFKYTDFLLENLARIPGLSGIAPLGVALPIGISFYTFQSMSYPIDVYRHDADVQHSPVKFGAYVSLFPQLIAGPIVRYKTIAGQLDERVESPEKLQSGVVLFIIGLSKKVLLANAFGQLWDVFGASDARSALGAWIGIAAFALQIYFDFGGYSDMAVGLGRMFGFDFPVNFRYPYLSRSVSEFWGERWHISLGTWFREYVYIPLGGNRRGLPRNLFNLAVVWLLTGLWHGASWNFLLWGAYYAVLLIVEKLFLLRILKRAPAAASTAYTLLATLVGWVIFALTDMGGIAAYLRNLVGVGTTGFVDQTTRYALSGWLPTLLIGVVAATPLCANLFNRLRSRFPRASSAARAVLCLLALALCTAYIVDASYNPFLYFRF